MFEKKNCPRVAVCFPCKSDYIMDQGIGVNWLQHWYPETSPRDCAPPVSDRERWKVLFDELSFAMPSCIRYGYPSTNFVDEQGRLDWQADGFIVLSWLDTWAKEHGSTICFDPWVIPEYYAFGKGKDGILCDAPRDIPTFVKGFVVPLVRHLKSEMKLDAVTDFILMNEPLAGESYRTPEGIDQFEHYVECYRAIHDALVREGLPIRLIGPDTCGTLSWAVDQFNDRGLDFASCVDAFDQHHYSGRFDYLPPNHFNVTSVPMTEAVRDYVSRNARFARHRGKPYYMTELGTTYYGWRRGDPYGSCTHEAFLTEAEFIIRALQVGCGGFYRWAFLAPGEYHDGVWQFINTVDGSYTRQPHTFYGYASLMRYTGKNAGVWPSSVSQPRDMYEYVQAVGLEMPDGTYTILVVNDHNCQERVIEMKLPQSWKSDRWQKILNDRTRKMVRNDLRANEGVIEDVLPPMGLAVYTTRRLPDDDGLPVNNCVYTQY